MRSWALAASSSAKRLSMTGDIAPAATWGRISAANWRVTAIFSVEFLLLGVTAGLLGSLLATLISRLLLEQILDARPHFDVAPLVVSVFGTALVANLAGWLASFHILGKKPLEVLRSE